MKRGNIVIRRLEAWQAWLIAGTIAVAVSVLAAVVVLRSTAATPDSLVVMHDTARGRIKVENNTLKLEFGYKTEAATHNNQGGGNLYYYYDKRYAPTQNIIAVWEGGSAGTKAYASGAGGIGSTQIYAVPDISLAGGATYKYALADNAGDGSMRTAPVITTLANGAVQIVFDVAVTNKDWSPSYEWYTVKKTWVVYREGRITERQDWRISKAGYFSEPASRNQVSTMFKTISRYGHTWSNAVAGPPGTNSRLNPANKWYNWTPNPASIQECNAPDGSGGSQDAVHADYNRFHEGASFDFWFWPDNAGKGYEGLGQYKIGYEAFGQSQNAAVNEICHHNRTLVGDGADAYNLGPFGWWGGDGATADRYKPLAAGKTWTDSFQMEARPRSAAFPSDTLPTPTPTPTPTATPTPTPVSTATPVSKPADVNQDGKVNVFDLSVLLTQWGKSGTADLDKNGMVNVFDLSVMLSAWTG